MKDYQTADLLILVSLSLDLLRILTIHEPTLPPFTKFAALLLIY